MPRRKGSDRPPRPKVRYQFVQAVWRAKLGRWMFRGHLFRDGKRTYGAVFPTQLEAHQDALQMRDGYDDPSRPLTLANGKQLVLDRLAADRRRPETLRYYRTVFVVLEEAFQLAPEPAEDDQEPQPPKSPPLSTITPELVAEFVRTRIEDHDVKPQTVKDKELQVLSRVFTLAEMPNPVREVRRRIRREPVKRTFIPWKRVDAFIRKVENSKDPRARRDADILLVIIYTGLRWAEMLRLDVDQVDLVAKTVDPIGKMENYAEEPEDPIPLHRSAVPVFRRLIAKALPDGRLIHDETDLRAHDRWRDRLKEPDLTPRVLRRAFATKVYDETKDIELVRRLLRHKSVDTTRKYLGITHAGLRAGIAALKRGTTRR